MRESQPWLGMRVTVSVICILLLIPTIDHRRWTMRLTMSSSIVYRLIKTFHSNEQRWTIGPTLLSSTLYGRSSFQLPAISFNPSMISSNSSGVMVPILLLRRSTDRVRIWLILTHERLGRVAEAISSVRGKPAVGG